MNKGIISAISLMMGGVVGAAAVGTTIKRECDKQRQYAEKHFALMMVLNQWLIDKQEGKRLIDFFENNNYKSIAIYGMSYLGERLMDELKDSDIEVKCAIDKNADNIFASVEMKKPGEKLPEVDVIIVTPVFFYEEIEKELKTIVNCPVISLEDIVYGV